jgi:hypothetical protein
MTMNWRRVDGSLNARAKFAFNELSSQQNHALGFHVDVMTNALQGCLDRGINRLLINAPPRSHKSHCAAVAFVIFALGHDPTRKITVLAGTRTLAAELMRRALALLRTPRCRALFPHLRPTVLSNEIVLPHGGGILYAAVGQRLIGRGADILVIDDPIAPSRAQDDAEREAINAYYDAEIVPRLNDKAGGTIVLVMQRVHLGDLTGHVRKRGAWTEVVLPAVALVDEIWPLHRRRTVRRRKGEVLQPNRESRDALLAVLDEIDAYNFSAQYLQQPLTAPGLSRVGIFYDPRPPDWRPEMPIGSCHFMMVREISYALYEVFGVEDLPPYRTESPYSDEEWEKAAIIQQERLVAAAKADKLRNEA